MDAGSPTIRHHRDLRGAGILVVDVKAGGESPWEEIERRYNRCALWVKIGFRPGSAVASSAWPVGRERVGSPRRTTLELPYFNLADGGKTTNVPLVIEIILREGVKRHHARSAIGQNGGNSCLLPAGPRSDSSDGHHRYRESVDSSRILAVGTIDVQTWLAKRRTTSAEESESERISLHAAKGGAANHLAFGSHESVFVWLRLAFSKAFLPQRAEEMVPAAFVAATTLFDCAAAMEEAELQLYARDRSTGDVSCLSRVGGGEIVVHKNFKWNLTADVSVLFPGSQNSRPSLPGAALLVLLCDRACKAIDVGAPYLSTSRAIGVIGSAEFSLDELVSCGATGRWRPLQACSVGWERWRRRGTRSSNVQHGGSIVGETLIAFAWIARPVAESLPRITTTHREIRNRYRRQDYLRESATSDDGKIDAEKAPRVDEITVHGPRQDHASSPRNMNLVVFIHVWDALLPRGRPECALYLTVKVSRRGSPGQRVSTKPALGQGGLNFTKDCTVFPLGASSASSKGGASSLHFVWDEHLSLSIDAVVGEPQEDPMIEFQLRDASVDYKMGNAMVAESDAEAISPFTARSRLRGESERPSSKDDSSSCGEIAPVVHHLRLLDHIAEEKGDHIVRDGASECFGVVKVRMASLVLNAQDAESRGYEVTSFRRQKADVPRVLSGGTLSRGPLGWAEVTSPMLNLPALALRKPARSRLLLDLSAAGGLFRKFVDPGPSFAGVTQDTAELSQSEVCGDWENTPRGGSTSEHSVVARSRRYSKLKIAKIQLDSIEREYFPRHKVSVGSDTGARGLEKISEASHDVSSMLTFGEFLSWLRGFSKDALGAAGLLVSPRTALDHTEAVMDESAKQGRDLAASLDRAGAPGKGLIGGWCNISLDSTEESMAFARVQLGWDEVGAGGGTAEGRWGHHTKMLRNDVIVLREALAELEGRLNQRSHYSSITENRSSGSVERVYSVEYELSFSANVNAAVDEKPVGSCEPWVMRDGEPMEQGESLVALYIEQEASRLAVAAEHLKEVLRCAGDVIHRDISRVSMGSSLTKNNPLNEGGVTDSRKRSFAGEGHRVGPDQLRRIYNVLLQHIKQVKGLQGEITALHRRASTALSRNQSEQMRRSLHGDSGRDLEAKNDDGAPRSALALVRRIRQAQEAPRLPAVVVADEISSHVFPRDQSTERDLSDQMVTADGRITNPRQMQEESVLQSNPNSQEEVEGDGESPRGSSSLALRDFEPPYCIPELQQMPSSDKVAIRLALARSAFKDSGVELPKAFLDMSAESLVKITQGDAYNGREANLKNPVSAVAICCPIDRFILHVFRTAGAASDGGSEVFSDVQELVATGGLDTHASGNSLWASAAQAGIVDVDRWVVAAVLWQVVHAVEGEESRARCSETSNCPCIWAGATTKTPVISSFTAPGRFFRESFTSSDEVVSSRRGSIGGSGKNMEELETVKSSPEADDEHESPSAHRRAFLVAAAARSLWGELRREAFSLVIGKDTDFDLSISSGDTSSYLLARGVIRGHKQDITETLLVGTMQEMIATGDDPERVRRRQREEAYSASSSFELALRLALVQAGRRASESAYVALLPVVTGPSEHPAGDMRVELQLLYSYAMAGFAKDSGLDLKDVVNAVRIRRARASSMQSVRRSPVSACGRCPHESPGLQTSTKREARVNLETWSTGYEKVAAAPEVNAEEECRHDHRKTTEEEKQSIVGVPPELQELFHAAAFAQAIRTRHRDGEQSSEPCALETAEAHVVRVLYGNRTLESAAFAGGKTALHHAAARGDDFLVRLLLERGCKPHLKDFEGKHACDLARSLECLRLLGALKKAPEPSALSLRPQAGAPVKGCEVEASRIPPRQEGGNKARAMTNVNFAVSFQLARVNPMTLEGRTSPAPSLDTGKDAEEPSSGATGTWIRGIARWFDLRSRVMYVEYVGERGGPTASDDGEGDLGVNSTCPLPSTGGQCDLSPSNYDRQTTGYRYQACHALDVVLVSCLSPRGAELFNQLQAYAVSWKTSLAAEVLGIAIDAAAEIGARCRLIFHEVVVEVVLQVAREAFEEVRCVAAAVAAEAAAVSATSTGSFEEAHVPTLAGKGAPITALKKTLVVTTNEGQSQLQPAVALPSTENTPTERGADKVHAARKLNFQCLAIIMARDSVPQRLEVSEAPVGRMRSTTSLTRNSEQDRCFLAKLTVENGVCVVEVSGSSYLDVADDGRDALGRAPVNLDGRDVGVQRVLDYHGVSLVACVQTFDVMQDMEQPGVVLEMLAASICQLSLRFSAEGVNFSSLDQFAQDALKAHVRKQLRHSTRRGAEAGLLLDWEVLKVTMPAYGGVTSVRVVKTTIIDGGGTMGDEGDGVAVSSPLDGGGWFRPEDVIEKLGNPQESSSTLPYLPPSAVNLVVSLMGRNPCEVLISLRPGTGADGRLALIGRTSEGLGGAGEGDEDRFRCSLEVAWDMEAGEIFVKRFVIEENEKRPRFSLRAVGVRDFSIAQLPVTLDDIDAVWGQPDNEEASVVSEEASHQSRRTSTTETTTTSEDNPERGQDLQIPEERISTTSAKTGPVAGVVSGVKVAIQKEEHGSPDSNDQASVDGDGSSIFPRESSKSSHNENLNDMVGTDQQDGTYDVGSSSTDSGPNDGIRGVQEVREIQHAAEGGIQSRTNSDKIMRSEEVSKAAESREDRTQQSIVRQETDQDHQGKSSQLHCRGRSSVNPLQGAFTGVSRAKTTDDEEEIIHVLAQLEAGVTTSESSGRIIGDNTPEPNLTLEVTDESTKPPDLLDTCPRQTQQLSTSAPHRSVDADYKPNLKKIEPRVNEDQEGGLPAVTKWDTGVTTALELQALPDSMVEGNQSVSDGDLGHAEVTVKAITAGSPVEAQNVSQVDVNGAVMASAPEEKIDEATRIPRVAHVSEKGKTDPPSFGAQNDEGSDQNDSSVVRNDGNGKGAVETLETEEEVRADQATYPANGEDITKESGEIGQDTVSSKPEAITAARSGAKENTPEGSRNNRRGEDTDSNSLRAWILPASFQALAELCTATTDVVKCSVEGEIALREHPDRGRCWQSLQCTYKIPAEGNTPRQDIDLKDDATQDRLEYLLAREYGLTLDDVVERFRPEIDPGSDDAVIRSFAHIICKLWQFSAGGVEGHQRQFDGVRKAVGHALRGSSEWEEIDVEVADFRVEKVKVLDVGAQGYLWDSGGGDEDGGEAVMAAQCTTAVKIACEDCLGVATPQGLKTHVAAAGVPESVTVLLEKAGFFAGEALDVASVLAALAEEWRRNSSDDSPTPEDATKGQSNLPAMLFNMTKRRRIHLATDDDGRRSTRSCCVTVSGTPEDFVLEISPGDCVDETDHDSCGDIVFGKVATSARVSCLRVRATSSQGSVFPAAPTPSISP